MPTYYNAWVFPWEFADGRTKTTKAMTYNKLRFFKKASLAVPASGTSLTSTKTVPYAVLIKQLLTKKREQGGLALS